MTPARRKELKAAFKEEVIGISKFSRRSKHHNALRIHSLVQAYKAYIYKEKFGLSKKEVAVRLGVAVNRIYELERML